MARRRIELACAQRSGRISLLALDWKKAFDSVNVECLLDALRRFGLPPEFRSTVGALLRGRQFFVRDSASESSLRKQLSGVSQGCVLSPMLFVIVMSVLMADAVNLLPPGARRAFDSGDLADLCYADDNTLLIGVSATHLQDLLEAVGAAGQRYGLELHTRKLQLMNINHDLTLRLGNGHDIVGKHALSYLGATLSADGSVDHELSRRIGAARGVFAALSRVWHRPSLSCRKKICIFQALVVPTVLYGLAACCLNIAQQGRLNSLQCRCLRPLLGIRPAYFSRISNVEVLRRAGCRPLTEILLNQQLLLLGRALRAPTAAPLHSCAFVPGTDRPLVSHYIRRVGRPRKEWAPTVLDAARSRSQTATSLWQLSSDTAKWRQIAFG